LLQVVAHGVHSEAVAIHIRHFNVKSMATAVTTSRYPQDIASSRSFRDSLSRRNEWLARALASALDNAPSTYSRATISAFEQSACRRTMRQITYSKQLARVSLLLIASVALTLVAQDWYHERGTFFRGEQWHAHVFARVHDDLSHIYSAGAASDKERNRIERTKEELNGLQAKLDQRVWDNGTVNDVIDSLRKSANDERLGPQDRQVLSEDAARIHDFQRNHNEWLHHKD
jgi:hypothetical protein